MNIYFVFGQKVPTISYEKAYEWVYVIYAWYIFYALVYMSLYVSETDYFFPPEIKNNVGEEIIAGKHRIIP